MAFVKCSIAAFIISILCVSAGFSQLRSDLETNSPAEKSSLNLLDNNYRINQTVLYEQANDFSAITPTITKPHFAFHFLLGSFKSAISDGQYLSPVQHFEPYSASEFNDAAKHYNQNALIPVHRQPKFSFFRFN